MKMDVRNKGYEDQRWMEMMHHVQWQTLEYKVLNLRFCWQC